MKLFWQIEYLLDNTSDNETTLLCQISLFFFPCWCFSVSASLYEPQGGRDKACVMCVSVLRWQKAEVNHFRSIYSETVCRWHLHNAAKEVPWCQRLRLPLWPAPTTTITSNSQHVCATEFVCRHVKTVYFVCDGFVGCPAKWREEITAEEAFLSSEWLVLLCCFQWCLLQILLLSWGWVVNLITLMNKLML